MTISSPPKSLLHRTCFDQYFSCSGMTGRWGLYLMHRMQFVIASPIFGNRVSTSKVMPTAPPLSKRSVETPWKHRLYMHLFFVSSSNHVASISTCRNRDVAITHWTHDRMFSFSHVHWYCRLLSCNSCFSCNLFSSCNSTAFAVMWPGRSVCLTLGSHAHSTQTAKEAPVGNELCSQISLLLPAPVFGNCFTHVSMSKVTPTAPLTGCSIRPR